MNNVALLIAEAPWFLPKDNHSQASCLPYFTGVKSIVNGNINEGKLTIYNCSFYDDSSLAKAVEHLIKTDEKRQIMYLGAHGDGRNIAGSSLKKTSNIIRENGKNIKGMIISSCWAAANDTISESMGLNIEVGERCGINENYGPNWVFSYKVPVEWFHSVMIETSIIKLFSDLYIHQPQYLNSKTGIVNALSEALGIFNQNMCLGFDDNMELTIPLKDSIRIWVRPQGSQSPKDVTNEIIWI